MIQSTIAIVMALTAGLGDVAGPAPGGAPVNTAVPVKAQPDLVRVELTPGANAFAVDLYARLAATNRENLLFSPTSIHTALGMVTAAARGRTAEQMRTTLHYTLDDNALHPTMGKLLRRLNKPQALADRRRWELSVANALWGSDGLGFDPAYLDLLTTHYTSTLTPIDFTPPEPARKRINAWVSDHTAGRIPELLAPGALGRDTKLVLTNAVYFKAAWNRPFDASATADLPFHRPDGTTVNVPTLRRTDRYAYAGTDTLGMLRLPYVGNKLAMYIFLPTDRTGLADLEKTLSAKMLTQLIDKARPARMAVSIPKFTFRRKFELSPVLAAMGMPDAFDGAVADFSAMTTSKTPGLAITKVIHEAFIAVDEKGTEAAAATAIVIGRSSIMPASARTFAADHPFLFLIRHEATGAILFIGRVTNPEAKSLLAPRTAGGNGDGVERP